MATVRWAMPKCSRSTMRPSTTITPFFSFSGWPKASITLRDHSTSSRVGEKISLHGQTWLGVDQRLAVHAERAAALALLAQAKLVPEVVIDPVDDVEAVGARGDQGHGEPRHDGEAVMQGAGAQLLDQVVGAHDQAAEPVLGVDGGGGDGACVEDRHRRLHHRPQPDLLRGMHALQDLGGADDVAGMHHLRHEDGVGLGLAGGEQIVGAPRRLQRVDPDDDLAAAIAAALDRGADLLAGERLGVGRHGIFEIEDQGVGGDGLGLFQGPLVRARHIEHAAARPALHGCLPSRLLHCNINEATPVRQMP